MWLPETTLSYAFRECGGRSHCWTDPHIFFLLSMKAPRPPESRVWPDQGKLGLARHKPAFSQASRPRQCAGAALILSLWVLCLTWILFIFLVNPFWARFSEQTLTRQKPSLYWALFLCASRLTSSSLNLWSTKSPHSGATQDLAHQLSGPLLWLQFIFVMVD